MATLASFVIYNAHRELSDPGHDLWPLVDLVYYLNQGQLEAMTFRPDLFTGTVTHSLSAGSKQSLPVGYDKLIEIVRNTGGKQRAVTRATRELLDAFSSGWYGMRTNTEIQHYCYDLRDPRTFYVYPPAADGASLEMVLTALPDSLTWDASWTSVNDVTGNIDLPDSLAQALTHYILYRCFDKDTESTAHATKAAQHYQLWQSMLGVNGQATSEMGPNSSINPNRNSSRTGVIPQ